MAMNCRHKEYAEVCEILVVVDAPAPLHLGLYLRLRFGLLASSWLPRPLGVFLWSALHVMLLIVCGPIYWILSLLTLFLLTSVLFGGVFFLVLSLYVVFGSLTVAADLVLLLVESIMLCWSLVGFLARHEPIFECRGGGDWLTVGFWKNFKSEMRDMYWGVPIGVPCMRGSWYKETKNQMLETWARWWEEVLHKHDAIAL